MLPRLPAIITPLRLILLLLLGAACSYLYVLEHSDSTPECIFGKRLRPSDWNHATNCMFHLHAKGDSTNSLRVAHMRLDYAEAHLDRLDIERIEASHHVGWLLFDSKRYSDAENIFLGTLPLYREHAEAQQRLPESQRARGIGVHGEGNEYVLLANIASARGDHQAAAEYSLKARSYFRSQIAEHGWYYKLILENLRDAYQRLGDTAAKTAVENELQELHQKGSSFRPPECCGGICPAQEGR